MRLNEADSSLCKSRYVNLHAKIFEIVEHYKTAWGIKNRVEVVRTLALMGKAIEVNSEMTLEQAQKALDRYDHSYMVNATTMRRISGKNFVGLSLSDNFMELFGETEEEALRNIEKCIYLGMMAWERTVGHLQGAQISENINNDRNALVPLDEL